MTNRNVLLYSFFLVSVFGAAGCAPERYAGTHTRFEDYERRKEEHRQFSENISLHGGISGSVPVVRTVIQNGYGGPAVGYSIGIFEFDIEGVFGDARDRFHGFAGLGERIRLYPDSVRVRTFREAPHYEPYLVGGLLIAKDLRKADWNGDGKKKAQEIGSIDVGIGVERSRTWVAGPVMFDPYAEVLCTISDDQGDRGNPDFYSMGTTMSLRAGIRIRPTVSIMP